MDKWHLKSQSATEFISLVGFLLLFFIVFISLMTNNAVSVSNTKRDVQAEDMIIKVQKEILLAARSVNEYTREFNIPEKLGSHNYSISSNSGEVTLIFGENHYVRKIPDVNGDITKGSNIIYKRENVIYLN